MRIHGPGYSTWPWQEHLIMNYVQDIPSTISPGNFCTMPFWWENTNDWAILKWGTINTSLYALKTQVYCHTLKEQPAVLDERSLNFGVKLYIMY